jgi:hypothetical protein
MERHILTMPTPTAVSEARRYQVDSVSKCCISSMTMRDVTALLRKLNEYYTVPKCGPRLYGKAAALAVSRAIKVGH